MPGFPKFLLPLLLASVGLAAAHEPGGQVSYLGNEGILVSACDTKVLFDAFYDDDYGQYVLVPTAVRDDLLAGTPPYDDVDAVFVSHGHGDHFTAEPALAYLRAHSDVTLFGPQQVLDALRKAAGPADDELLSRVVAFDIKPGAPPETLTVDQLTIDVVATPHSGGARMAGINNLVFRVTLEQSATVMHLGDSVADDAVFSRQQEHWDARHSHAAFPPYWFLLDEDGRRVLDNRIRADQVVGIHVPAKAVGQGDAWREQINGDLFTDPGETRVISSTLLCEK